ncbi:MAG: acylphosphatase [Hydrogenophilales bacterium 12-61-10]|nr:MAG: acylphosphatase [Hydrogenophilales bacterium 12-61-10]OYX29549.1 MAG: acylphosphatase [Hydrogenophilales bacterium 32-62-9]
MSGQTLRLVIHGRVQGVFYRESLRQQALRLNVTGWARNRADGTVEAIIQGSADSVSKLLEWAHRGPPLAKVTHIDVETARGESSAFEIQASSD